MEITKREIIASISIIAIMLLIGVIVYGQFSDSYMDSQEKYNKAVKIETEELFQYGLDTSIGNAFVYGELRAIDPVSYPEIDGEYLSIKKVTERYTMHTRTVTYTDSNGYTKTKIETYWTWDVVDSEEISSKEIEFCGIDFDYTQFNKLHNSYITTIQTSLNTRYQYYGHSKEAEGTIFANLKNRDFDKNGAIFYRDKSIKETVDCLNDEHWVIIFWIIWILLTCAATYIFYYLDNNWLH